MVQGGIPLAEGLQIGGQIAPGDVPGLAAAGLCRVINCRPEGEADDQPLADQIAASVRAYGLVWQELPVAPGLPRETDAVAFVDLVDDGPEPVFAFCNDGHRPALLWAFGRVREGMDADGVLQALAEAGYGDATIARQLRAWAG